MDGWPGLLLMLLTWAAFALAEARKRKRTSDEQAAEAGSEEGASPVVELDLAAATARADEAVRLLEEALGFAAAADCSALGTALAGPLEEAKALKAELARSAIDPKGEAEAGRAARSRAVELVERARAYRRLAEQRADPARRDLLTRVSAAIELGVPALAGRLLVLPRRSSSRAEAELAAAGWIVLGPVADLSRRPWEAAALLEEAWAAVLFTDEGTLAETMAAAAEVAPSGDAMERFAAALATAWAPALLLDVAATLSIGGGHAARVARSAMESPLESQFVVNVDLQRRVDSAPPPGLRLRLLGRLLRRLGISDAAAVVGPPPVQPVLHLRGPSGGDQVPLGPIVDAAALVQAHFASGLEARPELARSAAVDEAAGEWLADPAGGSLGDQASARTWLAALGRSALRPDALAATGVLLVGSVPQPVRRWAEAPSEEAPPRTRARRPVSTRRSRALALRQALLLDEVLGNRRN